MQEFEVEVDKRDVTAVGKCYVSNVDHGYCVPVAKPVGLNCAARPTREFQLLLNTDQHVIEFLLKSFSCGFGFGQADDHVDANFAGVDQGNVHVGISQ